MITSRSCTLPIRLSAFALAFIEKRRVGNDAKAKALNLIGNVHDRDVIIVDDEVDTGGSMVEAVHLLKDLGARDIYMSFVHASLSKNSAELLGNLPVKQFITTDTIPISQKKFDAFKGKLKILTVSTLIAEVIRRANEGRSVGEMFNE